MPASTGSGSNQPPPDYRQTLLLPKTDFPMKGKLPTTEPARLASWERQGVYAALRKTRRGREKFILHDGPPYANGDLHMGTAMNKILKDLIVRSQTALGKDAPYIPGWDCHGLPIEWKVEEQLRAEGKSKGAMEVSELRARCREFASHWIDQQRDQFRRLGVLGDWESPYLTMDFRSEAIIAAEFMRCNRAGLVYRGAKPVMWSVVEQTALAEAEVEYIERVSHTLWVRYPVGEYAAEGEVAQHLRGGGSVGVVIWTTTPWTIPASMAICYGAQFSYGAYRVAAINDEGRSCAEVGDILILGDFCASAAQKASGLTLQRIGNIEPARLGGVRHPWHSLEGSADFWNYPGDNPIPIINASHVTDDSGTGFVHTAPAHGADDYNIGVRNRSALHSMECNVRGDGTFDEQVPLLAGAIIITEDGKDGDANHRTINLLRQAAALVGSGKLRHSYPHSWRSRAPLIFRATPQWFIDIDKSVVIESPREEVQRNGSIRQRALESVEKLVRWFPPAGQNRLHSMIADRPDWVLSRQRAWGVPLTLFVERDSGEVLRDEAVDERVYRAILAHGADAWFNPAMAQELLGDNYNADQFEQVTDILDVWFDSGASHAYVMDREIAGNPWNGEDIAWPASMYLEGSDQHRGWFQASMLESCATRGRAPYESVLTHGFVLDSNGRKMSKSLGNTILPAQILQRHGADIMRVWVASTDYAADMRVGSEILGTHADTYRKLRNMFRFMLGNLSTSAQAGADITSPVPYQQMPQLEQYILMRLAETLRIVQRAYGEHEFKVAMTAIVQLVQNDLSSFYFDIRKDRLYCDDIEDPARRACIDVIRQVLEHLCACLMPIIPFTIDEVWDSWLTIAADGASATLSHGLEIDITSLPLPPSEAKLEERWNRIRTARRVMTSALEVARTSGVIGGALEAEIEVYLCDRQLADALQGIDVAELAIVSRARVILCDSAQELPSAGHSIESVDGVCVIVHALDAPRCERSWRRVADVATDADFPDLSARDATVMRKIMARQAGA